MTRPDYLNWKKTTLERIEKITKAFKAIRNDLEGKLNATKESSFKIGDQSASSLLSRINKIDSAESGFHQSSNTLSLANRRLIKLGHHIEIFVSLNSLQEAFPQSFEISPVNPLIDVAQKNPLALIESPNELCSPLGTDQLGVRVDLTINIAGRRSDPSLNSIVAVARDKDKEQFQLYQVRGARLCDTGNIAQPVRTEILNSVNEELEQLFPVPVAGKDSTPFGSPNLLSVFDNQDLKKLIGPIQFYSSQLNQGLRLFGHSNFQGRTNLDLLKTDTIDFNYGLKIYTGLLRSGLEKQAEERINKLLAQLPNEVEKELSLNSDIQETRTAVGINLEVQLTYRARIKVNGIRVTVFFTATIKMRILVSFSPLSAGSTKGVQYSIKREGDVQYSYKARTRRSDRLVRDSLSKKFYNNSFVKLEETVNRESSEISDEERISIPDIKSVKLRLTEQMFVLFITA